MKTTPQYTFLAHLALFKAGPMTEWDLANLVAVQVDSAVDEAAAQTSERAAAEVFAIVPSEIVELVKTLSPHSWQQALLAVSAMKGRMVRAEKDIEVLLDEAVKTEWRHAMELLNLIPEEVAPDVKRHVRSTNKPRWVDAMMAASMLATRYETAKAEARIAKANARQEHDDVLTAYMAGVYRGRDAAQTMRQQVVDIPSHKCTSCGETCFDYRQQGDEHLCISCAWNEAFTRGKAYAREFGVTWGRPEDVEALEAERAELRDRLDDYEATSVERGNKIDEISDEISAEIEALRDKPAQANDRPGNNAVRGMRRRLSAQTKEIRRLMALMRRASKQWKEEREMLIEKASRRFLDGQRHGRQESDDLRAEVDRLNGLVKRMESVGSQNKLAVDDLVAAAEEVASIPVYGSVGIHAAMGRLRDVLARLTGDPGDVEPTTDGGGER